MTYTEKSRSEAQKRADAKYKASHTKQLRVELNIKTDADIMQKLETVTNKAGYIKQLIRADISK